MAEVFISYARADEARARAIHDALEARGLDVFWDRELRASEGWFEQLAERLTEVDAVIVLWSQASATSDMVRLEALAALAQGKLIGLRLESVTPPNGFSHLHAPDFFQLGRAAGASGDVDAVERLAREKIAASRARLAGVELAKHQKIILAEQLTHGYGGRITKLLNDAEAWLEGGVRHGRNILTARAFTYELLNLTLLLAVAYPVMLMLMQFAVLGQDVTLGGVTVVDASKAAWWAPAAIGGLVPALVVLQQAQTLLRRHVRRAGGSESSSESFAFAVAFAVAGAFASRWLGERLNLRAAMLALFAFGVIIAVDLGLASVDALPGSNDAPAEQAGAVLVFLVLLPIVNGLFDFLSIGLTRALLRVGARLSAGWTVLLGLLDLLLGFALFVGLGCASIWLIHEMRVGGDGGATLVDLGVIFRDIRESPGAYWWLYLTYFSTLIPTLFHGGAIAAAALDGVLARGLFSPPAHASVDELDALAIKARFRLWLASWLAWPIGVLMVAALVGGFLALGGGWWLLDIFERFAGDVGALD